MRRTFVFGLLAAILLVCSPRDASATLGGPETVQILGYEPIDGKVFMLRSSHNKGDALPRLE